MEKSKVQRVMFQVTDKDVEEAIAQVIHMQAGYKTSVCLIMLSSGTECVGYYSPISVDELNPLDVAANKKIAYENALVIAKQSMTAVAEWREAVHKTNEYLKKNPNKGQTPNQDKEKLKQ